MNSPLWRVFKYTFYNLIRTKSVPGLAVLLFVVSLSLFYMESDPSRAGVSLLNIILFVVPLFNLIFALSHVYNSLEFLEVLSVQPIPRQAVFKGYCLGLAIALAVAYLIGVGVPVLVFSWNYLGIQLILSGLLLGWIFCFIGAWIGMCVRDKSTGIGLGLLIWFYCSVIYDGLLLLLLWNFSDYPIEPIVLPLAALNPVDLGRIAVLLQLDLAALMGYSGAVYKEFFQSEQGIFLSLLLMGIWIIIPAWFAYRAFLRKDF